MGIHDRDYARERPGFGGGPGGPGPGGPFGGGGSPFGAMRMWSANTWIIVICVAVFVIDSFTPLQPVGVSTQYREIAERVPDDAQVGYGPWQPVQTNPRTGQPRIGQRPVLARTAETEPVQIGVQTGLYMNFLERWLHFSTARGFQQLQFWRFIGFQFLHGGFTHILFNMIGLFFFGPIVERYLGAKRYLAFYLLCGICGALMYTLLNIGGIIVGQDVPGLLVNSPYMPLVGASAGVFGVLMAGAYLAPNVMVLLFFFLPMRLKTLAYALVAVAVATLLFGGRNAGGEAGHLGGAIAGFYFIRRPHHLHGFFDVLGRIDPTSHHYRGKRGAKGARKAKLVKKSGGKSWFGKSEPSDQEIDRILDKISTSGLHSLTEREKKILGQASHRDRRE